MMAGTDLVIRALMSRMKANKAKKQSRTKKKERVAKLAKSKPGLLPAIIQRTKAKAKKGTRKIELPVSLLRRRRRRIGHGIVPLAPRLRRRRRSKKAALLLSKGPRYDESDRAALARMTRQRVDWAAEEDRYVLCLFLASIIFIPRYNLHKVFMFNAPQIRDVLHKKLPSSQSKTSLALRRRLHFLMRNETFYARYRYYLSEALRDEFLQQTYVAKLQQTDGSRKFYQIPTPALMEVFDYLLNKFQRRGTGDEHDVFVIKDTSPVTAESPKAGVAEVQKKSIDEHVEEQESNDSKESHKNDKEVDNRPQDPASSNSDHDLVSLTFVTEKTDHILMVNGADNPYNELSVDIWIARTAILSLILGGDSIDALQTFMSCINDDVMEYVVLHLKNVGITTWNKEHRKFGFSATMKRKIQANMTPVKYREGYKVLPELRRNPGNKHNISSSTFEDVASFSMLCEMNAATLIYFVIDLPDTIITINDEWKELFNNMTDEPGEGPSDVYYFGFGRHRTKPEKTKKKRKKKSGTKSSKRPPKRHAESSDVSQSACPAESSDVNPSKRPAETSEARRSKRARKSRAESPSPGPASPKQPRLSLVTSEPSKEPEPEASRDERGNLKINSDFGSVSTAEGPTVETTSPGAAGVLGNLVSAQNALESALLFGHTVATPAKTLRMSNKALRLIRSEINAKESGSFVDRDFFNVNMPTVTVVRPGQVDIDESLYGGQQPTADVCYLENLLIKIVPNDSYTMSLGLPRRTQLSDIFGRFYMLYQVIDLSGVGGVSVQFLVTKFTRRSVREGIAFLTHNNSIYLVGVTYRKYVSSSNVLKWTMPVSKSSDSFIAQRVIMRPWIRNNGAPNWPLLDQCFTSLLGYLNVYPDVTVFELCANVGPVLSRVEAMLLIEALVHLEFFKYYTLDVSQKVSLFSPLARTRKNYDVDPLLDQETLHLEMMSMPTMKYADLQERFNPAGCQTIPDVIENTVDEPEEGSLPDVDFDFRNSI